MGALYGWDRFVSSRKSVSSQRNARKSGETLIDSGNILIAAMENRTVSRRSGGDRAVSV
jgi:hypothetical protein